MTADEFEKIKEEALNSPTPATLRKVCECYESGLGADSTDPESIEFHIKLGNAYLSWKEKAGSDWREQMMAAYEQAWKVADALNLTHEPFMQSTAMRVYEYLAQAGADYEIATCWYNRIDSLAPAVEDEAQKQKEREDALLSVIRGESNSLPTPNNSGNYHYNSSGGSMSGGAKIAIAVAAIMAVLGLFGLINSGNKSKPSLDSVTISYDSYTIAVGQTAEVKISSSASRLTANFGDCIETEWNNDKSSGDNYYLNVTGLTPGTCTLKVHPTENEEVFDTAEIVVTAADGETDLPEDVSGMDLPESTEVVPLASLEYWDQSTYGIGPYGPYDDETLADNLGNEYDTFYCSSENDWAEYRLDGAYSTLEGRFIIEYEFRDCDDDSYMWVYGDGQLLYGATMKGGLKPLNFRVDVSGVDILKIRLDSTSRNGGNSVTDLVDMHLCKAGSTFLGEDVPVERLYPLGSTTLASLDWWNKGDSIGPYSFNKITDNAGNDYYEHFSSEQGWQEYAIEGKYSTFNGRLIIENEYNDWSDEGTVEIYGDDNLLYSGSVAGQQMPVDFSVDIAGVQYLKVVLRSPTGMGGYEFVDLVNAYLI